MWHFNSTRTCPFWYNSASSTSVLANSSRFVALILIESATRTPSWSNKTFNDSSWRYERVVTGWNATRTRSRKPTARFPYHLCQALHLGAPNCHVCRSCGCCASSRAPLCRHEALSSTVSPSMQEKWYQKHVCMSRQLGIDFEREILRHETQTLRFGLTFKAVDMKHHDSLITLDNFLEFLCERSRNVSDFKISRHVDPFLQRLAIVRPVIENASSSGHKVSEFEPRQIPLQSLRCFN